MPTETTVNSAKGWSPDLVSFAAAEVIPDALIMTTSTISGRIEGDEPVLRVVYVDDDEATFVAEGAVIPEADPDLNEVLVATGKVAQLVRISREQYGQGSAASLLSDSVRRAVVKAANRAYLGQVAPTPPAMGPAAGLLNVAGVVDGGDLGADLDALADAVAAIETAGGTPTHIIAAPDAWAALRKLKTGTGAATSLLGAGTNDVQKMLLGVPVLTTAAMPSGELLVIDRASVVSAVGDVQVATSSDAYFTSDSIGLRCVFRFGQNVVRPDRLVRLSVAA